MVNRKPLEDGCTLSINCPLPGHTETVTRAGGRFAFRHTRLTAGQRRTHHERVMAEMQARRDFIESRHGGLGSDREHYADGTHWEDAHQEWRRHQSAEQES